MKKALSFIALGSILTLCGVHLAAVPATNTTIMGEVIDIATFAMKDARGEAMVEAGKFRSDSGFPIGILDEAGEVYIAVYKNPAPASALETANELLGELMGKQVVARGKVYKAPGVNVIEISIASEM